MLSSRRWLKSPSCAAGGKKEITVSYGSQFWALTSASIDLVLRLVENDWHLVRSFAYSPLPDEAMIQSILHTYLYKRNFDSQPIYADFHSQSGGPRILNSIAGLPFDLQEHQVFVRKVDPHSTTLAGVVSSRLLAGQSAWGGSPATASRSTTVIEEADHALPIATVRLAAPAEHVVIPGWHGVESYMGRRFRWTASTQVDWIIPLPDLPPGRLRIFLPLVIAKPGMMEAASLCLREQQKTLRYTRHSLIAEFDHEGLPAGTLVTLKTPPVMPAAPPRDDRLLGLGIGVEPEPISL